MGPNGGCTPLTGVVHIGARELLDINLIWFGYRSPVPVGRRGGILLVHEKTTLPLRRLEEGEEGVSTLWSKMRSTTTTVLY
jgi:hypothetical protein